MDGTNPIYVLLLLLVRLGAPILIVIGVVQLLERWGLVAHDPKPPKNW